MSNTTNVAKLIIEGVDKTRPAFESAKSGLAGVKEESVAANAASQQFLSTIQRQAEEIGKTRAELLEMKAASLGVTEAAAPYINKLREAANESEHVGLKTAGARREILVLLHELSTGNYKRAAGSIQVLGERLDIMGKIMSPVGMGVLGLTAVVAGLIYTAYEAAKDQDKLTLAIRNTGNYAGMSEQQIRSYSAQIAEGGKLYSHEARNVMVELAASGRFTGDTLQQAASMVADFARATGTSADAAAKELVKMYDDPSAKAKELNQSMHFLNAAELRTIENLQKAGDQAGAAKLLFKSLGDYIKGEAVPSTNLFARALHDVVGAGSSAFQDMEDHFNGGKFQRIKELQQQLQDYQGSAASEPAAIRMRRELAQLQHEVSQEEEVQRQRQKRAQANANSRVVDNYLNNDQFLTNAERRRKALDSENRAWDVARGKLDTSAGDYLKKLAEVNQRHQNAINQITDQFKNKDSKGTTAFSSEMEKLGSERAALEQQIALYDKFGKVIKNTHLAILDFEISNGKFKGSATDHGPTAAQLAEMRQKASALDSRSNAFDQRKAVDNEQQRLNAWRAEIAASRESNTAKQEAIRLSQLEHSGVQKGSAAYQEFATQIHKAAIAEEQKNVGNKIDDQQLSLQNQIKQMQQEASMLGMTTLERKKATYALQQWAKAEQDIKANPNSTKLITDATQKRIQEMDKALTASDAVTGSWLAGAKTAASSYQEAITNAAHQSSKVVSDSFNGMESALTNFVEHGKLNFDSLAQTVVSDMIRMEVQQNIMAPMTSMMQNSSIFSSIGSMLGIGSSPSSGSSTADAATLANFGPSSSVAYPYANGGIMSSSGNIPLNTYANGGIANSPQLAIFGEGRLNEAYVPLPDGKSIPVNMNGQISGGAAPVTLQVNIQGSPTTPKVNASQNGSRMQLDILFQEVDNYIASGIQSGNGSTGAAIARTYGADRSAGAYR